MRIATQYLILHQVTKSGRVTYGPQLTFTTGAPSEAFPVYTVGLTPNFQASTTAGFLLLSPVVTTGRFPIATDLSGSVVWYYNRNPAN